MKFGCCLNMVASGADKTGVEKIHALSSLGFDYAELPLAEISMLSASTFEDFISRFLESGLPCESCNNLFPTTLRLTGPNVNFDLIREYCQRAFDLASRLGAKTIVFGSGGAKNIPEGFDFSQAYDQVVFLLQYIDRLANRSGITVCIEPLRKAECNLINSFEQGCKLASDVGGTNVKVLVDLFHLAEEKEPVTILLQKGREYLRHVHFAVPVSRRFPISLSQSPQLFEEFFNALKSIEYDGCISCEAYSDDFVSDAGAALKLLKTAFCE